MSAIDLFVKIGWSKEQAGQFLREINMYQIPSETKALIAQDVLKYGMTFEKAMEINVESYLSPSPESPEQIDVVPVALEEKSQIPGKLSRLIGAIKGKGREGRLKPERAKKAESGPRLNKKTVTVILVVTVVLLVILGGLFFISKTGVDLNGSSESEPVVVETVAPKENTEVVLPKSEKAPRRELLKFDKISSIKDFFVNFDLKLVVFLIVLAAIVTLAIQERFAESQQTSLRAIYAGGIFVLLSVFGGEIVYQILAVLSKFFLAYDLSLVLSPATTKVLLGGFGLVFFFGVSLSGKKDFTPLSVGLTVLGGLLYAFKSYDEPTRIFALILQFLGLLVHIIELIRQNGSFEDNERRRGSFEDNERRRGMKATGGAVVVSAVGLLLFLGLRYGLYALIGLIPGALTADTARIWIWLAGVVYNNNAVVSTVVAIICAFSFSNTLASAVFPIMKRLLPKGGEMIGVLTPTEETPRIDAVILFFMILILFWIFNGGF